MKKIFSSFFGLAEGTITRNELFRLKEKDWTTPQENAQILDRHMENTILITRWICTATALFVCLLAINMAIMVFQ